MDGELVNPSLYLLQKQVSGYSIDTRTLAAGELFFAVSGERFDAHTFVPQAMAKGAAAVVVAAARAAVPAIQKVPHIVVDDPLHALQRLGATVRRHWHGTLIGLTGSAGKTTTKEMTAAVLAAKHRVLKSAGNLNNHFGVPLQLLRLEPEHVYAVIEMGMSAAGEIALLADLAAPARHTRRTFRTGSRAWPAPSASWWRRSIRNVGLLS
jgi:UDP-N-acetylmuramoyl-tripeptide--D-alanyl-D-alanine ligase